MGDYVVSRKKCAKCDGVMEVGKLVSYGYVRWQKGLWDLGPNVVAYKCEKCGYVELYVE